MTLLLDITLSPLFALKKNAIITYFEISLINTERANNFMTLVAEEIGNANVVILFLIIVGYDNDAII